MMYKELLLNGRSFLIPMQDVDLLEQNLSYKYSINNFSYERALHRSFKGGRSKFLKTFRKKMKLFPTSIQGDICKEALKSPEDVHDKRIFGKISSLENNQILDYSGNQFYENLISLSISRSDKGTQDLGRGEVAFPFLFDQNHFEVKLPETSGCDFLVNDKRFEVKSQGERTTNFFKLTFQNTSLYFERLKDSYPFKLFKDIGMNERGSMTREIWKKFILNLSSSDYLKKHQEYLDGKLKIFDVDKEKFYNDLLLDFARASLEKIHEEIDYIVIFYLDNKKIHLVKLNISNVEFESFNDSRMRIKYFDDLSKKENRLLSFLIRESKELNISRVK